MQCRLQSMKNVYNPSMQLLNQIKSFHLLSACLILALG